MLHGGLLPLLAALRDDLLVDGDLGADDLNLRVIETERGVKKQMVLEGLPIDVKGELTDFLVEIDSGFDAANIVRDGYRAYRSSSAEGNASLIEVGLVEGDVDCLVLGKVLGNQHVLFPSHEELEVVCPDQTSSIEELDGSSMDFLATIQVK